MDVDNGPMEGSVTEGPVAGGIDVQSLVQQFSCLGTTDKNELVQQLQKILDSRISYGMAEFFLDMNNWNLQAAACSYLDIYSTKTLPSMCLVTNSYARQAEYLVANTRFEKIWEICNNGPKAWPLGIFAHCTDGHKMGGGMAPVASLYPGEQMPLIVDMMSPSQPGTYHSKWRLCTQAGTYFGDPMWAIVTVYDDGTTGITEQLSSFNELGAQPPPITVHNPFIPQRSHIENSRHTPTPEPTDLRKL